MADVDVKKQPKTESGTEQRSVDRPERPENRAISRGRGWDPFSFSLIPSDFFGTDPFSFMRNIQQEMDRRFDRFFDTGSGRGSGLWNPAIDVEEREGKLHVHAELAGIKPEDVKVEVTDTALVIEGERKCEHDRDKGGVYRSERCYGKFYRQIPLPEGVNTDEAKARFRDGVLEVTLPLPEQKRNRRSIPVQS